MMVLKKLPFKFSTVFEGGKVYYAMLSINIYWIKYGSPGFLKKSCNLIKSRTVE